MRPVICGIRYEFKGYENLPTQPAILLSKHQSAWETIFMLPNMTRPLVYVFKKEILYIPFFGWGMALLRMIPIDRKQGQARLRPRGQASASAAWPTASGSSCSRKGRASRSARRASTRAAARAWRSKQVPMVVPIAHNSGECWPKNSFIKRPGLITVSIGKPISPENHTPDSLMQEVENWIESEMRVISPHAYSGT